MMIDKRKIRNMIGGTGLVLGIGIFFAALAMK